MQMTLFCAILFLFKIVTGSFAYLILPPAFGRYTDHEKCNDVNVSTFLVYSNVPVQEVPQDARCVKFTRVTPVDNDFADYRITFSPTGDKTLRTKLMSSVGQVVKNVLESVPPEGKNPKPFSVLYTDCSICKITSFPHPSRENACMLFIAEMHLREESLHCHFIFDLLCGVTKKYLYANESCLTKVV